MATEASQADDYVLGTAGNDTIDGGSGYDNLVGGAGDDVLIGGDSDDCLTGGDGNDHLLGGTGNDWLIGSGGKDTLQGGLGDDIYIWTVGLSGAYGGETEDDNVIDDAGGTDNLRLNYVQNSVELTKAGDDLLFKADGKTLTIKDYFVLGENGGHIESIVAKCTVMDLQYVLDHLKKTPGEEPYSLPGGSSPLHRSTGGSAMATGTSQGAVNQIVQGGCIILDGPVMNLPPIVPPLMGTNGNDVLSGNQGDDHLVGGAGNDRLDGYQGNDTLDGGDGDDHLDGYQDDNLLIGGNGNDTLTGGSGGHHTLQGGAGDDVYETTNGYFYDISDTSGNDTVEFVWGLNQLTGLYRVGAGTPGSAGNDLLLRFGGTDVLIRNYFVLGENGGHIENLKIRDFAVHAPDAFVTWQLQDVLNALNNPQPPLEDEYFYGTDGNDVIDGGTGDDYLNGHGGHDTLIGGDGNDTLNGHADDDTLMGGKGDDVYQSSFLAHPDPFGGTETEVIADTGGTDTVQLIGINPANCTFIRSDEGDLFISFGNGNSLTMQGYFTEGPDSGYIENIDFGGGKVWHMEDVLKVAIIRCGTPLPPQDPPIVDLPDLIVYNPVEGTEGADTLYGSELKDFVNGFGGDDVLEGAYDDDILMGGTGNDTLVGGMGADTLFGGVGRDVYEMTGSADLVANGGDVIDDEGGDDTLHIGWGGPSEIIGMAKIGDDLHLSFGNGMLCVVSNLKIENYFTSSGHIEKITFSDKSVWSLADINAHLSLEPSTPQEPGISNPLPPSSDAGGDMRTVDIDSPEVFSFASARAAGLGKTRSKIDHFEAGTDTIDLSGIDANTKVAGDNAFKALLTGKKPFTKAGQLHYDAKKGILSGNTDKDAAAEFQIQLKNKPELLRLSDFVL